METGYTSIATLLLSIFQQQLPCLHTLQFMSKGNSQCKTAFYSLKTDFKQFKQHKMLTEGPIIQNLNRSNAIKVIFWKLSNS
jgi:hypothetical protein